MDLATIDHDKLLTALRAILADKGIASRQEIAGRIAITDAATPARGAAMVAKAWVDPAFRALMLADGARAAESLGIPMRGLPPLGVLENTAETHHLVVCTLCSCYPFSILGLSPSWYKSNEYRARVVRDPRGVLEEFGVELDEKIQVRVWDSTSERRYLVVPEQPKGVEDWDEEALAAIVTRNAMIGTERDLSPSRVKA